ncbi:MAG: hypothetical protein LCH30_07125 [Proteobacteria bacterium]|nr:hypothetical protein [Pseudomonadota bacterium]
MQINLKNSKLENVQQTAVFEIKSRLPSHVKDKAVIHCDFSFSKIDDYFLLDLSIKASLDLICQRCLADFKLDHTNQTQLAISDKEKVLERLMENYDCITAPNLIIDLVDILTDELYLYVPEFHALQEECDEHISAFISEKNANSTIK